MKEIEVTINTYARLDAPNQFRPSEEVTFRCYYSADLCPNFATLVIEGGHYGYDKMPYHQTQYANTVTGGVRYEDFIIPANSIGEEIPDDVHIVSAGGKLVAYVIFHENEADYDSPLFTSNKISVPLYLAREYPLTWENTDNSEPPSIVTSSTVKLYISYDYWMAEMATSGSENINSYRYFLYDENENVIWDSGTKYDWVTTQYGNHLVSFAGLKDNTKYFYKARAELVGGYQIESEMKNFTTKFESIPQLSEELSLRNNYVKGCVTVKTIASAPHTSVRVSRTVKDENNWIALKSLNTVNNIAFNDYMVIPNETYTYCAEIYNNGELIETFYAEIKHRFDGVCISDIMGSYCTDIETTKYDISKNERTIYQETYSSKYPTSVILDSADFHKSSYVKGAFFDSSEECIISMSDIKKGNAEHSRNMLNWLNNGNTKFLKYDDGFCAIVTIQGEPSISYDSEKRFYLNNFSWVEIADCKDFGNYTKYGLIGEI